MTCWPHYLSELSEFQRQRYVCIIKGACGNVTLDVWRRAHIEDSIVHDGGAIRIIGIAIFNSLRVLLFDEELRLLEKAKCSRTQTGTTIR